MKQKHQHLKELRKEHSLVDYKINQLAKQLVFCPAEKITELNRTKNHLEVLRRTLDYKIQNLTDGKPLLGYGMDQNAPQPQAPIFKSTKN